MIALLTRRVRRWRLVENLVVALLLADLVSLAYLLYKSTGTFWHYLWLGVGFVVLFISWLFIAGTVAKALRSLSHMARLQSVQAFDSLYERSPVAYLSINKHGRIHRANPAATHLFADTIDMIGTRNLFEFIQSLDDGSSKKGVFEAKVAAGLTLTDYELPIVTMKGESRWVLINVFATELPEERLIEVTDITDQRAIDTAKSEFVALATHQLRTPIAAIRWNVELLVRTMRETKTEKQDKYLIKIERNVLRMLNLINDFLSVSKLEMGTYAAEPEVVNFAEYLDGILDEFEEKVVSKQLTVNKSVNPETMRVSLDRRLFHIILSNLVSNAVKYTPASGTVNVEAVGQSGTLTLTVADSGIGIPKSEQADLFKKFFRASNAQEQVTEGTGLGLYVVKQSVEILGGTLTVQSAENQGTAFTIRLPDVVR